MQTEQLLPLTGDYPSLKHRHDRLADTAEYPTHSQLVERFQPPPAPRWSWAPVLWLAVAVIAAGAVAYAQPWQGFVSHVPPAPEHTAAVVRTVHIEHPVTGGKADVQLPATIRPWQATALHARVSGYLAAWHKDLGETVQAGELLAEIDTPELDQELAEAQALVREGQASVTQARAERVEAEADLKVAEAELVSARAEAELAQTQLVRRAKLLPSKAITQEEYDTFQTQVETRLAAITATESDIARRRTNLETRAAIIEAREATVNSRQANVDRLQELQIFKKIKAPFAGVITRRAAEVGMLVTAGKEALFQVEDVSRVRVQLNVPQTYAQQTRPGVTAVISLPEAAGSEVVSTVTRVTDSVDATSRTMLAEIELENGSHHFQPGSYAQVKLTADQGGSAWTIPANTLAMRVDGPHVATVNPENRIELKLVSLGRNRGKYVEVTEGITGTERLVVNPTDDLINGVKIQVSQPADPHAVAQR